MNNTTISRHPRLVMRQILAAIDSHIEESESLTDEHQTGTLPASQYLDSVMSLDSLTIRTIADLASGKCDESIGEKIKKAAVSKQQPIFLASTKIE